MKRSHSVLRAAVAAVLLLAPAAGAFGVRRTEDPLALVPADAATVGVMRWNELRQTPLGAKVFSDIDHMSGDDDAARFLQETGLTPREDIDTVIVAMSPRPAAGGSDAGLVLFEGRFDLARIASALTARGARLQASPAGELYLLPDRSGESGAVALVNRTLLVCGHEAAVAAALARRESGGEGGLTSGQGLGRQLSRIDQNASAWALVDLARMPSARPGSTEGKGGTEPSHALMGAMKSVSLIAVQATVRGGSVDFAATGLSPDAENRALLEDALKGMLAMWRLAISDKAPELVSVIRKFEIDSDGEGVSIHGTLPAGFLESLAAKHRASR
jgi:hypothetical protein